MILAAWYHIIFSVFFAFLAILLMLVILLQRGKGVGLAGAFGGAGGNTAFGAKTGDVLTWATIALAGVFLLAAVILNLFVFTAPAPTLRSAAPVDNSTTLPPDGADMPTPAPVRPTPTPATRPAPAPATTPTTAPAPAPAPVTPTTTPSAGSTTPVNAPAQTPPATSPASAPANGNG